MGYIKRWAFLLLFVFLSACGGGGGTTPPSTNTAPSLSLSVNAVTLDEDFGTFIINTTATDAEDGDLPVAVTGQDASLFAVTTSTNQIMLTSVANANGIATLTVSIVDSGNLSASTEVVVVVNAVNDTPTLTFSTTQFSLNANFMPQTIATATDVDDASLLLTFALSATDVVQITTVANRFILNPITNAFGETTITLTATDNSGNQSSQIFTVRVNGFPTLALSTQRVTLDEDFGAFIINTTATDAEDGVLPVAVTGQDASLFAVTTSTDQIMLTSVANANGTVTLTVSIVDSGNLSASTEVVVVVNAVNDTPTLSLSSTNLTLLPNSTGRITAFVTDVETSSASLTFSVQQNPSLLQVSTPGNVIVLRSNATTGSTTLVITVTDGDGLSTSATAQVTVRIGVLNIALNVKRIDFSWENFPAANHYRMLSNVDLNTGGGFVDASSASLVFIPNSTNIINTTVSAIVDVAGYLSAANGPQYLLQACTSVDNSVCSDLAEQTLSNAQLEGVIGYFKALNTGENDQFGTAVAISGDGNTLVVGAPFEDSTATGINGDQTNNGASNAGAVYVFVRNSAGSWRQQAYVKASNTEANDRFGTAVSISDNGNTLIVGAFGEDSTSTGINGNETSNGASGSGAAYVFVRSSTAGTWSQQAYLKASNTGAGDDFGRDVSISGDGNTLIVGAPFEDSTATGINGDEAINSASGSGAAYVFVRSSTDSSWSQQVYLKASNTGGNDQFGTVASISSNGNTIVVGARLEASTATGINGNETSNGAPGSGAAYVFVRSSTDSSWSQQAYLKASNTDQDDRFGTAVSASDDGNTLIVGALLEDSTATGINGNQTSNGASNSGAAYVFVRSSTDSSWSQQAYLKASNTDANDTFGNYVAISGAGNTLIVSAPNEDSNATGINGDQSINVSSPPDLGAAYLFVRSSTGTWSQQAYIKASNNDTNTSGNNLFGSASISDDGKTLAVGAPFEDSAATGINGDQTDNSLNNAGAVYLY